MKWMLAQRCQAGDSFAFEIGHLVYLVFFIIQCFDLTFLRPRLASSVFSAGVCAPACPVLEFSWLPGSLRGDRLAPYFYVLISGSH